MDPEPKEFKDVTIYTTGNVVWDNIIRIDAARASIWVAPFAQHPESVHIKFNRRGRRKGEYVVCSGAPYVVIVPTKHAIEPDDLYLPEVNGVASTRYGVGDPRWRTDFDHQLSEARIPILADFRNFASAEPASEAKPELVPLGDISPANLSGCDHDLGLSPEDLDYEEGIRKQREQLFFERNQRLVKQAKKVYGCLCQACGFDFVQNYGALGLNFAEVHHLNPFSDRPPEEWTIAVQTNIADLAILCANCHRMIHRRKPALSIDELRMLVAANQRASQD